MNFYQNSVILSPDSLFTTSSPPHLITSSLPISLNVTVSDLAVGK